MLLLFQSGTSCIWVAPVVNCIMKSFSHSSSSCSSVQQEVNPNVILIALQTHRDCDAFLQELISEAAESVKAKCVLCLGHNKGWEEAASDFAASCSATSSPIGVILVLGAYSFVLRIMWWLPCQWPFFYPGCWVCAEEHLGC